MIERSDYLERVLADLPEIAAGVGPRMHALLERNSEGNISAVERRELESLVKICQLQQVGSLLQELHPSR